MSDDYLPYITTYRSIILPETTSPLSSASLVSGKPSGVPDAQELPVPQLNKLMELRDALVALKGPLANEPGLRESIESQLFNSETNDRVLGKPVMGPSRLIEYWPLRQQAPNNP